MKLLIILITLTVVCHGQLVFTSGTTNNLNFFEQRGNQVVPINTGRITHNHLALSRDGRFATFADVDQNNMGGQVIPSSDLYEFDRATEQTRQLVDHTSFVGGFFNIVSSGISSDNQFFAMGTEIPLRSGLDANGSGRILTVYDRASRMQISDATAYRFGAVSDSIGLEFAGISWSPRANSFITPNLITVNSPLGIPIDLHAIVRFDRNASGQWVRGAVLSTPAYLNNQLPPAGIVQAYPAYSPSGQGIAYFSLFYGDLLAGSVGMQASVVVANADGSNPRSLVTFNPGFMPTGLTCSTDGSQIIVSIAPQINLGSGFLTIPRLDQSIIRAVSFTDGTITQLSGVDGGSAPGITVNPVAPIQNLSSLTPTMSRTSNGQLLLQAPGLDPAKTFRLLSFPTLNGTPTSTDFTGSQFATGIQIPTNQARRFFRVQSL